MATVLERVRVRRLTMRNMRPNARHCFQSPARTKAVRLKEMHGQTSLRLLRAWDVISLTDKKSVFRHLHGQ
jgi:ribosomal protein L15E